MNDLEKIREMIGRVDQLTSGECDELATLIESVFGEYDAQEVSPESINVMNELADAATVVTERRSAIETAEAEARATRDRVRETIDGLKGEATTEGDEPDEASTDAPATEVPEAIAAAAIRAGDVSRATGLVNFNRIAPNAFKPSLVAAGQFANKSPFEAFVDRQDLARTMSDVLQSSAAGQRVVIASARWLDKYDESRRLRRGDVSTNMLKIDAVTNRKAMAASGGVPLPVNVDYRLDAWANADRKLRDFFPAFGADHGGLTFRQPGDIGALAAATTVWTEATDANPAGATKAVYAVTVPGAQTVYVDAISTRVQFGNMMGQFDPDLVANNTELSLAAAARTAEVNLLTHLLNASTEITSPAVLGASRTFVDVIEKVLANFRWTHRLDENVQIAVALPSFVKNMIRADRALELAHDSRGLDLFTIADEWVESIFTSRNLRVCWFDDGMTSDTYHAAQNFAAFVAGSAVPGYPANVLWFLHIDGSVQYLDGGQLNLGVVRDSLLDGTNDYETFAESFEGLAFRGFANGSLAISTTVAVNGESSNAATYAG